MNTDRPCGCKSFRTCFLCEKEFGLKTDVQKDLELKLASGSLFYYSLETGKCESFDNSGEVIAKHNFPGIQIIENFVSEEEEGRLVQDLDSLDWDASQSGRRKQNFGPRANFKKRKAKSGDKFLGFPSCTEFIQERFSTVPLLEGYRTVEQCSIEYKPETGACIEPHIDDCWIWGERIVQLNLLSDTYLTLVPYQFPSSGEKFKYNIQDVPTYPKIIEDNSVAFNPFNGKTEFSVPFHIPSGVKPFPDNTVIKIPLPPRSLLVMFGEARYCWEHMVLRGDITDRRVVIAYRELTPPYLQGGEHETIGRDILEKAALFW